MLRDISNHIKKLHLNVGNVDIYGKQLHMKFIVGMGIAQIVQNKLDYFQKIILEND